MKTAVDKLIAEIQRRVTIIQSEPQTMARELMIENLAIELDSFKEIEKEQHLNTWCDSNEVITFKEYYNKIYGGNK